MKNSFDKKDQLLQMMKPIDDPFFQKLIEDPGVCEEILRVILEDPALKVIEVIPQDSIRNLQGRSVCLDALCRLGDGSFCNIEMQKSSNCNHFRRVRFHSSVITANITDPGDKFQNIPDVCIIYISRFDIMKDKHTVYHVCPTVLETGEIVSNGHTEIYVNTKIDDGSEIAELMKCLEQPHVNNPKFPRLSERIQQFKNDAKGGQNMYSSFDEYVQDLIEQAREETRAEMQQQLALAREEDAAKMQQLALAREEDAAKMQQQLALAREEGAAKMQQQLALAREESTAQILSLIGAMANHGLTNQIPRLQTDSAFRAEMFKQFQPTAE